MSPEEARGRFSEAYEGSLKDAERVAFERALGADETLRADYESFRRAVDGTRALGRHAGSRRSRDVLGGVQRKLRERSGGRYYRDRFAERAGLRRQWPLWVATATLMAIGLVWMALRFVDVAPRPAPTSNERPPAGGAR